MDLWRSNGDETPALDEAYSDKSDDSGLISPTIPLRETIGFVGVINMSSANVLLNFNSDDDVPLSTDIEFTNCFSIKFCMIVPLTNLFQFSIDRRLLNCL